MILIAEDVTPVMLGEVATKSLKAIVSIKGSANSHVAILARGLGIPAVMGAVDLPLSDISGAHLIIDGWRGEVIVEPSEHVLAEYQQAIDDAAILEMVSEALLMVLVYIVRNLSFWPVPGFPQKMNKRVSIEWSLRHTHRCRL